MEKIKSILGFIPLLYLGSSVFATTYTCSSCPDCNEKIQAASAEDVVYLIANIIDHEGDCIEFNNKDGITFDCQGNRIEGDSLDYGILLEIEHGIALESSSGNTIKNCNISIFGYGIDTYNSDNNTIAKNVVNNNVRGISLSISSDNNNLSQNTANCNEYTGIVVLMGDSNTIIGNNVNSNDFYGVHLQWSRDNTVIGNTLNYNSVYGLFIQDSVNNSIDSNYVCSNLDMDLYITSSTGDYGDGNTCDNPDGWSDTETTGCTYPCGGGTTIPPTSTSTITTTTTTISEECPTKGDQSPCDGTVSDLELLGYIDLWVSGEVTDFDLLEAIDNWAP